MRKYRFQLRIFQKQPRIFHKIFHNKQIFQRIFQQKRGRPAGAKNKAKPSPKPKPKAKQKKPVEYEEYEESEEDEAPPPRRSARHEQPVELDRHALPVRCLEFFNSSDIKEQLPGDRIMPPGSKICSSKVNDEETDYE